MKKWLTYSFLAVLATLAARVQGQNCPSLIYPAQEAQDIPVDAAISWTSPGDNITGFIVSIGTTPGGVDILTNRTSSPITGYTPELGLPEDRWIYISFILIRVDGSQISCPGFRFRTAPFDRPPGCTRLTVPRNGADEVALSEELRWSYTPRATGYRVTVESQGQVLYTNDVGNVLSVNPPGQWPANTELTVTITPYNRLGPSPGPCAPDRFTTGASSIDCEPHRPAITSVPEEVGLCQDSGYADLIVGEIADGYNWFRLGPDGQETLISSGRQIQLSETGLYRLEVYNHVGSINEGVNCSTFRDFRVLEANPPVITDVSVNRDADGLNILVQTAGNQGYEYSLSPDSGFQDSPYFSSLPLQGYTVYVRDPFGCEITEQQVARNLSPADFPAFFTPNSDGINDFWKFEPPPDLSEAYVETIRIFDRYGNFLAQVSGDSPGWDGNFNGRPLPSTVYWFEAISLRSEVIRGYFALKR